MNDAPYFQRSDISRFSSPDGLRDLAVLSPALGRRADVTVFAPRGHEDTPRLPLLTLLHGVYGSHWAWARSGLAHLTLQRLVESNRIAPMILAMPSDGLFGVGSGYLKRPDEDAERWITEEVPQAAKLVFPNVDVADSAIAGLSMGGWGALRLSARHPHRYRAAVGMSPLTRLSHVAAYAPEGLRGAHAPETDHPELIDLLTSRASELAPMRITCGVDDELIGDVRALHRQLDAAQISHEYAESDGAHTWEVWEAEMEATLLFIDAHRKQPTSKETA